MKKVGPTLYQALRRCMKAFEFIEMNYLIFFTSFIGILIMVEIVLRLLGLQGLRWIEEFGRMMLVTTTLVGSSIAVKSKGHMAMDALINCLPPKAANLLEIVVDLLGGAGFIWLGVVSFQWTAVLKATHRTMESIPLEFWWFWVIISIAFLTTGVRFLLQIVKNIRALRSGVYEQAERKEM